jgi:2-dehydropantoate 2-reductase
MREVLPLAQAEGIDLTEDDICYWLSVVDPLSPTGKPSMRQDTEAKRKTEVALFAGTVIELSTRYGLPCPVNRMLYDKILEMESSY